MYFLIQSHNLKELLISTSPLYYYMTALSKSNILLISHILQIHSGVVNEFQTDSCFDVYCDGRNEVISPLLLVEVENILSKEDSLENRVCSYESFFSYIDTRLFNVIN